MGDSITERPLLARALHVDMNPLEIAGQVGKLINHVLGDLYAVTPGTVVLGYHGAQSRQIIKAYTLPVRFFFSRLLFRRLLFR